ncbi:uncharacterized protein LOC117340174 isoform X2 [Pecten maximus]|uniref:uncharacterized protein LOC117340174 isoform X2 n=1 Tax=Pecten maximus TaxID=6579 RepID=UPI001457EDF8|nr:uncharacterized protein LOC117340174 isoform X2 [Pecten maximus]
MINLERIVGMISKSKTSTVKAGVSTHRDPQLHKQICASLFGKNGENLFQLISKSKIMFSVEPGKSDVKVIAANDEKLQKAKQLVSREIKEIRMKLDSPPLPQEATKETTLPKDPTGPSVKVEIPTHADLRLHDSICMDLFGPSGENLSRIIAESKIIFSVKPGKNEVQVTAANPESLEKAKELVTQEIQLIMNNLESGRPRQPSSPPRFKEKIAIEDAEPREIVGILIGRKGSNIGNISQQIGCHIKLTPHDGCIEVDVMDENKLEQAVALIKNDIQKIYKRKKKFTESVSIGNLDQSMILRLLIGRGGEMIRRTEESVGCSTRVDKHEPGYIVVEVEEEDKLAKAVQLVKEDIQRHQLNSTREQKERPGQFKARVTVTSEIDPTFGNLIGAQGRNIKRLRKEVGATFTAYIVDDNTLEVTANDAGVLEKAVEVVNKEISKIQMDSDNWDKPVHKYKDMNWGKVFSGEMEPLGIFDESDLHKESERIECPMWDKLEAADKMERKRAYFVNEFDRMIALTEEGKLWQFPIDNDQGRPEEEDVTFDEHVFLEPLIEDFPKKGPIRHFMELVIAGLSKNPHMSVKEKHEHIDWYREYFTQNKHLMEEELGDLAKMAPQVPQQV